MNKFLFPFFALILIACSPQVTVTPQVTATSEVTITLTPTIIPSPTPQPPSPAFLDLQEEIAKSDIYTLTPNGIEIKNADGTIILIPDIAINPQDGTFTITYEDNKYLVEFISLDGQILTFKDEEENTFIFNEKNLFKTLSQEQLDQMTDEEKLKKAPEEMADLTKSNISTVKNNLVIYRDSETNAQKVFDLLTGKELTLPEAGIIEFNLTDGTKFEVPAFISEGTDEAIQIATLEEMVSFMIADGVDWGNPGGGTMQDLSQEDKDLFSKNWKIPSFKPKGYAMIPFDSKIAQDNKFLIQYAGVQVDGWNTSLVTYISDEGNRKMIFVNIPVAKLQHYFLYLMVDIPPKP